MTKLRLLSHRPKLRRDDGGVLVEFALVLPMMLALFALTVESARMMMSYQAAIAGVRDASRYVGRILPQDICATGDDATSFVSTATLVSIVQNDIDGNALLPSGITITAVTPSYTCVTGDFRVNPAPVGTVTAVMTLQFPFSGILDLFGGGLSTITTTITDQSRVYGI